MPLATWKGGSDRTQGSPWETRRVPSAQMLQVGKVDVIHSQLTSRVTPNMEGIGINEENIEPWIESKKSGSHKLFICILGTFSQNFRVIWPDLPELFNQQVRKVWHQEILMAQPRSLNNSGERPRMAKKSTYSWPEKAGLQFVGTTFFIFDPGLNIFFIYSTTFHIWCDTWR